MSDELTSRDSVRLRERGCRCDEASSPWRHSWHVNFSVVCPLHAAAPDLLAALQTLVVEAEEVMNHQIYREEFEEARAAIAKAKGEA